MATWEDGKFPAGPIALYEDEGTVADYDIVDDVPKLVTWSRPTDTFPSGEKLADPQLFCDGDEAGDVVQGSLDDAWFLGALAAIAAHPLALVQNLFVDEDEDSWTREGRIACRFYKDGEWVEVPVDTKLPVVDMGGTLVPVYGRCRNPEEQWVQMVEKAYAKLHGSYKSISGGDVGDALVDLTGGSAQTITLTDEPVSEMIARGELWQRIQRYLDYFYVITCAKTVPGANETPDGEIDLTTGLIQNCAYSILCVKEIGALKFVKVRNPWGDDAAWKGEWSDESPKWEEHPEVEQAIKEDKEIGFDRALKDGTFWMVWEDFIRQFDTLCMCRLFGEDFNQYLIQGEWEGRTAAGAHKAIREHMVTSKGGGKGKSRGKKSTAVREGKEDEGKVHDSGQSNLPIANRRGSFTEVDGDPRWFNNPQYRLFVQKDTECYISLMQKDRRMLRHGDAHYSIGFVLLKQKKTEGLGRVWEQEAKKTITDSSKSSFAGRMPRREVAKASIKLSPKYNYIVVPYTREWGVEIPFTMRVFTRQEIKVEALPELYVKSFEGAWVVGEELDTAGGPMLLPGTGKENLKFCQNPQYVINIPPSKDRVSLKVVVKRTDKHGVVKGKREGKTNYAGLVLVKPDPPPASGKKRREKITNFMGEPLTLHARVEEKLRQDRIARGEEAPPTHAEADVTRKLAISKQEWCYQSDFSDTETATCNLPDVMQIWMENGMVVVPLLQQVGMEGSYMLEVFSEVPVSMRELPQDREKTVASSWTEALCGGMHMNENWKRNPRFTLELFTDRPAKVEITLSRPLDRWEKRAVKDSVGCMIGFYVIAGTRVTKEPTGIFHEGKPFTVTPYMPVHKLSTPSEFYLPALAEKEVYTILPTTYEPERLGPFFVTVKADCDFRLSTK